MRKNDKRRVENEQMRLRVLRLPSGITRDRLQNEFDSLSLRILHSPEKTSRQVQFHISLESGALSWGIKLIADNSASSKGEVKNIWSSNSHSLQALLLQAL